MFNTFLKLSRMISGFFFLMACLCMADPVLAAEEREKPVILVLDPGHGGENEGTLEGKYLEKEMDLYTATRLKEYLEEYDGIQVYMTRNSDVDVDFKERAAIAKNLNADFLISMHYNASVDHDLFGSEVWIPSNKENNKKCYPLAYSFLQQFQKEGLSIRGIKIKLSSKKNADYYAIIRESAAVNVPAMILEHCHVDEPRDAIYCDSYEKMDKLAYLDSLAIAEAFHLQRKEDAANEELPFFDIPEKLTELDTTAPEICEISLESVDYEEKTAVFCLTAKDYDSNLIYYDYSGDGVRCSKLFYWPDSDVLQEVYPDTIRVTVPLDDIQGTDIRFRVYNLYDLCTESNIVRITLPVQKDENATEAGAEGEADYPGNSDEKNSGSFYEYQIPENDTDNSLNRDLTAVFFYLCGVSVLAVMGLAVIALTANSKKHRKKQNRIRKKR